MALDDMQYLGGSPNYTQLIGNGLDDAQYAGGSRYFDESTGMRTPGSPPPQGMKGLDQMWPGGGAYGGGALPATSGGLGGVPGQAKAQGGAQSPAQTPQIGSYDPNQSAIWTGDAWHQVPKSFGQQDIQQQVRSPWGEVYTSYDQALAEMRRRNQGDYGGGWNESQLLNDYYLGGEAGQGLQGMGPNNMRFNKGDDGSYNLLMKSGDKTGTNVVYRLNPQTGQYEPDLSQFGGTQDRRWETNVEPYNYLPLAIMAAPAAAALAGVGAAGGAAGAGAGAAGGGAGAAGGGLLESLMAGGLTGGAGGSTALGTVGSGILPTGAAGTLGGSMFGIPGAGVAGASGLTAGLLPTGAAGTLGAGITEGVGGTLGGLQGMQGGGGSNFLEQLQQLFNNTNMPNLPGGGNQQQPGQQQGGANGNLNSILQLLQGYYSSQQNKDLSGNLKETFSEREALQRPYIDQLLQSYQDPNSFYSSNQYKGLADVYQNQIDRQAGAGGRLANPTDREVLLQQHAMKELENYRGGLRGAIQSTDPSSYFKEYAEGLRKEAGANDPMSAAIGRVGSSGNVVNDVGNIVNTVVQGGQLVGDFWKTISNWIGEW